MQREKRHREDGRLFRPDGCLESPDLAALPAAKAMCEPGQASNEREREGARALDNYKEEEEGTVGPRRRKPGKLGGKHSPWGRAWILMSGQQSAEPVLGKEQSE